MGGLLVLAWLHALTSARDKPLTAYFHETWSTRQPAAP
jgi:hypothetical protein